MTRRLLLQVLLFLGGVMRAGAAPAPPAPLTPAELEDLVAFAEIVVEGGPLSAAARDEIRQHVAYRSARQPEQVALYRRSIGLLTRLAGGRFASLDAGERIRLVERHRLGMSVTSAAEETEDDERPAHARVVRDLIGGHYGSASGWHAVGYTAPFPGHCGDLAVYTRPWS